MHNVILVMVSSKWSSFFFPELFIMSHFSVRDASSFLLRSFKFSALSRREDLSKSFQGLNPILFILLLPEFFMEALHGGSSRIPFILQLLFSRFLSNLWSAKLYSKINIVFNTCFVLRSSSILHLAFRSAILSTLSFGGGVMSLLTISFMFLVSHVVKNEVF